MGPLAICSILGAIACKIFIDSIKGKIFSPKYFPALYLSLDVTLSVRYSVLLSH